MLLNTSYHSTAQLTDVEEQLATDTPYIMLGCGDNEMKAVHSVTDLEALLLGRNQILQRVL